MRPVWARVDEYEAGRDVERPLERADDRVDDQLTDPQRPDRRERADPAKGEHRRRERPMGRPDQLDEWRDVAERTNAITPTGRLLDGRG